MARVLAISSQVARGHVGLSAIVPALQRLGHEVWPLPTIILSNHPGHAHASGLRIAPAALEQMVDALDRNGWLGEVEAVITGYLPSAEHVHMAGAIVRRLQSERSILYLCDPVLGDEPNGLYLDPEAADAIRELLPPLADVITPNRFELSWLADMPINALEDIESALGILPTPAILVTSAGRRGEKLDNLLVREGRILCCSVPYRTAVPHGTGDFFGGLVLGHILNGATEAGAMARAAAGVEQAIAASSGRDELALVASQNTWANAEPIPVSEWKPPC